MDIEDVIKEVEFNLSTIGLSEKSMDRILESKKIAVSALEKQIPRKPIFNHNLSDTLSLFHCECGNTIKVSHDIGIMDNNNAPNYCSKCGQKLDWSDTVKAILVIDMPSSCDKCPLFGSHYSNMTCRGNERGINYPYPKELRQDWCPLKPMPEKMQVCGKYPQPDGIVPSYKIGYNACIDEILGDKE